MALCVESGLNIVGTAPGFGCLNLLNPSFVCSSASTENKIPQSVHDKHFGLFFIVHSLPMLNSHLAAKSFFSGLIFGFEMEKKEIPFPFPMSDLL